MKRPTEELAPITIEAIRADDIEPRRRRTQSELLDLLVEQTVTERARLADEFIAELLPGLMGDGVA